MLRIHLAVRCAVQGKACMKCIHQSMPESNLSIATVQHSKGRQKIVTIS